VAKVVSVVAVAFSVVALVVAIVALRDARQPTETPTYGEISAAAVKQFTDSRNQMTPEQVSALLGRPTQVYRDNPRALCWRYESPYEIRMCWGPKRERAWIAYSIPRDSAAALGHD
jgi:hypothetical protein